MKASIYTLISIGALVGACVGDDPVGSGPGTADGGSLDGGGSSGSNTPGDANGNASVELSVTPLEIAHGTPGTIEVQLVRRGSTAPVTLSVQSNVLGAEASGTVTVPANETAAKRSLPFSTTLATPTGSTTELYVVASASDMADVRVAVPLFVRGVPGELDTSYGSHGTASSPVGGSAIADAVITQEGGLFVIGNAPAVSALYNMEGALKADFGTGGIQTSQIPVGPAGDTGSFGQIRENVDHSLSIAVRGYAQGTTYNILRLDMALAAPYAPSFTPQSQPSRRLGNTCGNKQWVSPYNDQFRIVLDGNEGNCQGKPQVSAIDAANEGIVSFGTDGYGGTPLAETDNRAAAITSVRIVSGFARVLSWQYGTPWASDALTSVDLATSQTSRVQLGEHSAGTPIRYYFGEPRADGQLLIIRSGAALPCLAAVQPSGLLDPAFPATCRDRGEGDGRHAGGTYLSQGFAVVALGAESSLWSSADGTTLGPKTSLPTLTGGLNAEIVHVFEAPNRRILVLTREPGVAPWSIKRFWL